MDADGVDPLCAARLRLHSPNETTDIFQYIKGIKYSAAIIWEYKQQTMAHQDAL